jgi:hypothetical protein
MRIYRGIKKKYRTAHFIPSAMREESYPFLEAVGLECCKYTGNNFQISEKVQGVPLVFFDGPPEKLLYYIKKNFCVLNRDATYSAFFDIKNTTIFYLFLSLLYCQMLVNNFGNVRHLDEEVFFNIDSKSTIDNLKTTMQWCRDIVVNLFCGVKGINYAGHIFKDESTQTWKDAIVNVGMSNLTAFIDVYAQYQHSNFKYVSISKLIGHNVFPTMVLDWTFDKRIAKGFGEIIVSIDYSKWNELITKDNKLEFSDIQIGKDKTSYPMLSTDLYKPNNYENEFIQEQAAVPCLWLWDYTIDELCDKNNVIGSTLGFRLE